MKERRPHVSFRLALHHHIVTVSDGKSRYASGTGEKKSKKESLCLLWPRPKLGSRPTGVLGRGGEVSCQKKCYGACRV